MSTLIKPNEAINDTAHRFARVSKGGEFVQTTPTFNTDKMVVVGCGIIGAIMLALLFRGLV